MRVFGIDPGSDRTGYGCVDSDGRRHQLVRCGAVRAGAGATFPDQLSIIYRELTALLAECRPECVAIENIFHAVNARSALKLGHARGVAMLAAIEAGVTVVEYTPAEIKRSVVGLRSSGEAPGGANGEVAARPRRHSEAARRDGCARGGDLPSAQWQRRGGQEIASRPQVLAPIRAMTLRLASDRLRRPHARSGRGR